MPAWAVNQNKGASEGRPERIAVSRKFGIEDDKAQVRGAERTAITARKKSARDEESRSKKMKVRERKVANVEASEEGGLGFGRLLRILIMMCIIIGIAVFFGSLSLIHI